MKTHIARSIFDTQARLEQAVTVDSQTRAQGTPWISANFRETLVNSLAQLRTRSAEHGQVREAFLRIQKQRRSELDQLSRLVRDFFQVLRRRSNRLDHREALEALFKRPARVPQWASAIEWLQWANHIIQGEELAQASGYPAMTNPSAAEINAVLQRASASEAQWGEHFQLLKTHEQSLRQAREQGTRTLRGLAMRLRETLAHEAPATRRELMRTFGFSFISTGAKDRQKASGPSNLVNLIKAVPRSQEDADPDLVAPSTVPVADLKTADDQDILAPQEDDQGILAPQEDEPRTPAAQETAQKAKTETIPTQTPNPSPQDGDTHRAAPDPSIAEDEPRPKLSRRQKKALRRAQKAAEQATPQAQEDQSRTRTSLRCA